jgi:hypothetical protein
MVREITGILVATLCALAAGCAPAEEPTPEEALITTGQELLAPHTEDTESSGTYLLAIRVRISTIEVPVGAASGSEEMWSYLDEESIGLVRTPAMGLNGLRAGRGTGDNWPDVVRILRDMTGRELAESTVMIPPGKTIPVALKKGVDEQTLFTFRQDGTIHGADYPPGDNVLSMYCTLDSDDPATVLVTVVPQVRSSKQSPRFVRSAGGIAMISRPDYYPLTELTMQTRLSASDFLAFGPGPRSRRPSSVGHRFLVKERDGMEFETVLVIRAEVLAAPPN